MAIRRTAGMTSRRGSPVGNAMSVTRQPSPPAATTATRTIGMVAEDGVAIN
jgi:hypothetical protein